MSHPRYTLSTTKHQHRPMMLKRSERSVRGIMRARWSEQATIPELSPGNTPKHGKGPGAEHRFAGGDFRALAAARRELGASATEVRVARPDYSAAVGHRLTGGHCVLVVNHPHTPRADVNPVRSIDLLEPHTGRFSIGIPLG